MKKVVRADDSSLQEYLQSEFGDLENCCGVLIPKPGTTVEILEALETCHFSAGSGLDGNQCIPPGVYTILWHKGDFASHWGWLECINDGSIINFCSGYGHQITVDWRGAKKSPLSPDDEEERKEKAIEGFCKVTGMPYEAD